MAQMTGRPAQHFGNVCCSHSFHGIDLKHSCSAIPVVMLQERYSMCCGQKLPIILQRALHIMSNKGFDTASTNKTCNCGFPDL